MKRAVLSSSNNVAVLQRRSIEIMLLINMFSRLGFDVIKLMESINQECLFQ